MASITYNYIEDEYDHLDSNLEYVLENVLSEAALNGTDIESKILCEEYNSILVNCCKCLEKCDNFANCLHGGNYILNELVDPPELVLNEKAKKEIFYECWEQCHCQDDKCVNRLVQRGPRKGLQIIDSEIFKSKGLATVTDIPRGGFISEYAGELLTLNEAKKRTLRNENEGKMNYIICLNEFRGNVSHPCRRTFIDPSQKGNIGRYLNHSCHPNCEILSIRVDCPIPKLSIFSKRFIRAGEELCFHYGGENITNENEVELINKLPCLCHSENCSNFLPNIDF